MAKKNPFKSCIKANKGMAIKLGNTRVLRCCDFKQFKGIILELDNIRITEF